MRNYIKIKVGTMNVICPKETITRLENTFFMAKMLGYKISPNWTLEHSAESYVGWDIDNGVPFWSRKYKSVVAIYFITTQPKKQRKRRLRGKLKNEKVTNILKSIEVRYEDVELNSYETSPNDLGIFDKIIQVL